MAVLQVGLHRIDHDQYFPIAPDVPLIKACRCVCGAVRDTRGDTCPQAFGDWGMYHQPPAHWAHCAVCGCLALNTNSYVTATGLVHRACQDGAA